MTNDTTSKSENDAVNKDYKVNIAKMPWITAESTPFGQSYEIGEEFVNPGQSSVKIYECKRKKDKKLFIVKCVPMARLMSSHMDIRRQIKNEIDVMQRVKHKYIINMEECYWVRNSIIYWDQCTLYIVMEHYTGGDLYDRIKVKKRYKEQDAAPIIKMLLETLFYLHEYHHVVHCDIKPDSILFADKTENSLIKLFNFELSQVLPRLRSLRTLCSTPYYTAPEVRRGDYSHGCDMWSVGVVIFVMLFGYPPFYVDPNKYFEPLDENIAIYTLIQRGFDPKVKTGYGTWFPKTMPVSDESKDLMACLMESDTSKRLTVKEALQHPWILNGGKTSKQIETENESIMEVLISGYCKQKLNDMYIPMEIIIIIVNFYNIKEIAITKYLVYQFANFAAGHQFKHVMALLLRDKFEKIRVYQFDNMMKLFSQLDINGKCTLNQNEFTVGMLKSKDIKLKDEDMKEMFEELDFKKTGQIGFDNFLNAAIFDYLIACDKRLYEAFRELDDDGDGNINTSQLKQIIQHLDMDGNVIDLLKIIDDVDLDGNGNIDYEEFLRALHPAFHETPKWFWEAQTDFEEKKENK